MRKYYPLLAGEDTQRQDRDKGDRPHSKATPLMLIVCDFALFLDHAQSISCIGDGRSVGELMRLAVPLVELWAQRWGYDDIVDVSACPNDVTNFLGVPTSHCITPQIRLRRPGGVRHLMDALRLRCGPIVDQTKIYWNLADFQYRENANRNG